MIQKSCVSIVVVYVLDWISTQVCMEMFLWATISTELLGPPTRINEYRVLFPADKVAEARSLPLISDINDAWSCIASRPYGVIKHTDNFTV